MYLLSALAAGLVRCIYIDRLDSIVGQFREGAVPLYPLNKLLYIFCLFFLFMDLLLQTFDLGFEVFLFLGVVLAHHGEAFVVQILVGQFDDLIVIFFRIHFVKPPSLRFISFKIIVGVAKRRIASKSGKYPHRS